MTPDPHDADPATERRLTEAFHALATTEVPASAPRPQHAPRPGAPSRWSRSRRWQLGGGLVLAVAAAAVVAVVVGGEVDDARVSTTAPPATASVATTGAPPPVSTPMARATAATSTPVSPSGAPSPATSATSAATSAAVPGSGSGPVRCASTDVALSVTQSQSVSGSAFFVLHAVNRSGSTCVTTGFPGVAFLDASGREILQADRRVDLPRGVESTGRTTEPTTIGVPPGGEVSALLQAAINEEPDGYACPASPAFLVTMPDDTASTRVAETVPACGVDVGPFVAGSTGS